MGNTQNPFALAKMDSVEAFVAGMAKIEQQGRGGPDGPAFVKLDGNTGKWMARTWNKETRTAETVPFTEADAWNGTILLVRYFASWKYKKDAVFRVSTNEFSNFQNDPIQVTKMTFLGEGRPTVEEIARFSSYQDFKSHYEQTDEVTGTKSVPFDFYVNLYVYVHEKDQIVSLRVKGTSRSAAFDYFKDYAAGFVPRPRAMVEVQTTFGYEWKDKPKSASEDGASKYASLRLTSHEMNMEEDLKKIMGAAVFLRDWLEYSAVKREEQDAPVIVIKTTQEETGEEREV